MAQKINYNQSGSQVLAIATRTTNFSTTSTTAVAVPELTATVTVPPSGRIRVTVTGDSFENNTTNSYSRIIIWDGAVGSGTQIGRATSRASAPNQSYPLNVVSAIQTLTPGTTKTYNVSFQSLVSGTSLMYVDAGIVIQMVVEAV